MRQFSTYSSIALLLGAIWGVIQIVTNLYLPHSVSNMFGTWLRGLDKDKKLLVLVSAAATCWVIWRCCNDMVFDQKVVTSPSQVIYLTTHWFCAWTVL
jgi:hypothetical protein